MAPRFSGSPTLTRTIDLRRFGTVASRDASVSSVGTVGCDRSHSLRIRIGLQRYGMSPPPPPGAERRASGCTSSRLARIELVDRRRAASRDRTVKSTVRPASLREDHGRDVRRAEAVDDVPRRHARALDDVQVVPRDVPRRPSRSRRAGRRRPDRRDRSSRCRGGTWRIHAVGVGSCSATSTAATATTRCGLPSSVTEKSSSVRPRTGRRFLSSTETSRRMTSAPARKTGGCCCGGGGCLLSARPSRRRRPRGIAAAPAATRLIAAAAAAARQAASVARKRDDVMIRTRS